MNQPTPSIDNPLRLGHCMACGYALQGLREVGVCPECGQSYNQETVVLHGWARGSHANLGNASPRIVAWMLVPQILLMLAILPNLMWHGTRGLFFIAPLLTGAFVLWRRWTNPLPTLIQVHLSNQGCLQLDGPRAKRGKASHPWTKINRIDIHRLGEDRYRLKIGRRPNWIGFESPLKVDAEIQCTDEQADALRRRIEQWRGQASTGGFPVVIKGSSA
jgi:hypothetical protein